MSNAFYCDFCGEYFDGEPSETLYSKSVIDRQGTDYINVGDVCGNCWLRYFDGESNE